MEPVVLQRKSVRVTELRRARGQFFAGIPEGADRITVSAEGDTIHFDFTTARQSDSRPPRVFRNVAEK